MTKQHWMKFYPADWRAEPSLRFTSLAARGLWIEMLAIMHEAEPRGSLVVKGRAIDADRLAAIVGSDALTVQSLLSELEENGVFSRKKNGVIYSRRMERDENRARKNRENGEKGGNPTLCNQTEKYSSVNPPDKAKKPEARGQTKKAETNVSAKKGTRLPDDWRLDDLSRQHAVKLGLSPHQVETEADKFRDYWRSTPGQKGVKLDWPATWRNWIRNAVERQQRSQAPPRKTAHREHQDACHETMLREIYGDPFDEFTGTTIEH